MSNFPTHLIPDILLRLPVKPLLRFKCLSKQWGSLINDSNFAKLHLHQSLKSNTNVKLLLDNITENDENTYSVDFNSFNNLMQFPRPFTTEWNKNQSRIFGSCNGLVAVYHRQAGIALWNPSTRKCHYLPALDDDIIMDHDVNPDYEYDNNTILGFGHDDISNDYKVVEMLRSRTSNRFKVMIYSMKSNSWKRIQDCPYDIPYNYNDGAYTNGSLHWVGDKINDVSGGGGTLIFALDLGTEEFWRIPTCEADSMPFYYKNVGVLGGCLCVFRDCSDCSGMDHVVLWVMKEYGVKESWNGLIYLIRDNWMTNIFHTRALAYSRNGDKILVDDGSSSPAWFVIEDESGERLCIPGAPQFFSATIYVDSLVSVN